MSNDLNNLSVYEYIVAPNPEKAIEFLFRDYRLLCIRKRKDY